MNKSQNTASAESTAAAETGLPAREPYVTPVIEKFPPMTEVSFGTNIQPTSAQTIAFP